MYPYEHHFFFNFIIYDYYLLIIIKYSAYYGPEDIDQVYRNVYTDMYNLVYQEFNMRTNIVLDEEVVEEAQRLTGIKTKKALVHEALRVLIAMHKRKSLLDLRGRIKFSKNYDHREMRDRS